MYNECVALREFMAAGAYEEPQRSLFYRKSLGIRRYYENCPLCEYKGKKLYPSGTVPHGMIIHPHYMMGGTEINYGKVNDDNRPLIREYKAEFCKYASAVPKEHTVAGNMYCHSMPNYARIINEGFDSYCERIRKIDDVDFREGLLHVYEGIKCYIQRCVTYLESVNADAELVAALKKVPLGKADNIYEALVAWNFVMYLDNCDNLGCLAKELSQFYKGENIVPLLENLFDNLNENDGYSMALDSQYTELTVQCLTAVKGKRRPMIELFVDKDTPESVWKAAFEAVRTRCGQPAFYSTELLKNLKNRFNISDDDIKQFCGGGCTESMIAGHSNVGSLDAGINLLLILEQIMIGYLDKANSFEDFYEVYIKEVKSVSDEVMEKISLSQKERAMYNPVPMRTFLVDDCIDRGKDFNNGGARYNWSIINLAGIINVIDSLLSVKELVFDKKVYCADEFLTKLNDNDDEFLSVCRNSEHVYGTDDAVANDFAHRLSTDIFSMFSGKQPYLGGGFIPASIQFMSQVYAGKNIGATPDGRKAGEPLCDSLGAIFGKDTCGPTALLKSVTSLDLAKLLGVPVLNFNIDDNWNDEILKALILSYFQDGGIQMQITCISEKMLLEAYENPEMHKDLVVRVGGYSEYFYKLSDDLKKMIINRTIQNGTKV